MHFIWLFDYNLAHKHPFYSFPGSPVALEGLVEHSYCRYKPKLNPTAAVICKDGSVRCVQGNSESIFLKHHSVQPGTAT